MNKELILLKELEARNNALVQQAQAFIDTSEVYEKGSGLDSRQWQLLLSRAHQQGSVRDLTAWIEYQVSRAEPKDKKRQKGKGWKWGWDPGQPGHDTETAFFGRRLIGELERLRTEFAQPIQQRYQRLSFDIDEIWMALVRLYICYARWRFEYRRDLAGEPGSAAEGGG